MQRCGSGHRLTRDDTGGQPCAVAEVILSSRITIRIRRIGGQPEKLPESTSVSPTVLQSGPYRFFFFSSDRNEPTHVHVKRDEKLAKFWLAPVRMAYNFGFSQAEMNRIAALVQKHEAALSEAWHEYFKRRNANGGGQERSGH